MKNIDTITPFKLATKDTPFGKVTTLTTEDGISEHGSISFGKKTLLANYIYKEDGTYNLVYTIMDSDGTSESFIEDDGILPTLFVSPNQENYVSIVPYHPDKELEISIPVFHRENTELPKGNRPFTGNFMGVSNHYSIFYDVDMWSDTKPDKLLAIEFKNDTLKKKHTIKVPLPRNNKVFIEQNEIHLLAKEGNSLLHRLIDEKGHEIKQRTLHTKQKQFAQILSLSFDQNSYLLAQEKGKISIEKITVDGTSELVELIDIRDPFYNTWQPVKIAEQTFVTRFNGEFGNGWITTKNDQLLELFYGKGEQGYKNILTNEVLQMDYKNLVMASLNKTAENSYAVVFYPMTDRQIKNKELIILNRAIHNAS